MGKCVWDSTWKEFLQINVFQRPNGKKGQKISSNNYQKGNKWTIRVMSEVFKPHSKEIQSKTTVRYYFLLQRSKGW